MNRSLCCLLFAAVFLTTGCRDELDHELDRTIRELTMSSATKRSMWNAATASSANTATLRTPPGSKRTRAWAYTTLAGHYSHFQLDSSAYYCRMARALAEELGDERLIVRCQGPHGHRADRQCRTRGGQPHSAERRYDGQPEGGPDALLPHAGHGVPRIETLQRLSRGAEPLRRFAQILPPGLSQPRFGTAHRLSEKEFRSRTAASRRA